MPARRGDGPEHAKIMLVGEAYGEHEEQQGIPFVGPSGQLLNSMLHEAGIMRSECYVTNVVNARPPYNDLNKWIAKAKKDITKGHVQLKDKWVIPLVAEGYQSLLKEIELVNPHVIIAFGNLALWALTGLWGVTKWRGSQLLYNGKTKLLPTIHPAGVLREYGWRQTVTHDLRRAAKFRGQPGVWPNVPKWNFILRPSLEVATSALQRLVKLCDESPQWIEFDLETSPHFITCVGVSWSVHDAICIPFAYQNGDHYWATAEEEGHVIWWLWKLLTHPNCWVRGQNLLYDCQHTYRWWHFVPNVKQDTMISHHSMFSGMKKSLDFQASLYCDYYEYWKELHKDLSNKMGA